MPTNVEIKARLSDGAAFEQHVAPLADGPPETIDQRDTFFVVPRGRLKLREFRDGSGELIYYERRDDPGPEPSRYRIASTADSGPLRELLARAFGVRGTVVKRRRLYRRGQTRIHVDRVEGLGDFLELEVVLGESETPAQGRAVALALIRTLGVLPEQLVARAYIDLLEGEVVS